MKITILLILTILAPSLPAVEIIAHRGASHDAPENTLAAVNLAWKRNADAVEVDVYLSRDKKIVVIHDQDTARTTGHRGLVHRQTWAQLRKLDAGAWKAPQWKSEPIPSLEQVLKTIPKSKRLFIEIKCGPEIVPPLAILLAKTKTPAAQTAIIAFSLEVCTAAKKRLPALEVFYLKHLKQNPETAQWPAIAPTLAAAKTAQARRHQHRLQRPNPHPRLRPLPPPNPNPNPPPKTQPLRLDHQHPHPSPPTHHHRLPRNHHRPPRLHPPPAEKALNKRA
jgi:glycerophosphoryl diester phosphodiesterase